MVVEFITRRIVLLLQFIAGVCKKAMCCIRRRRRSSCDPAPLTTIGVVSNGEIVESQEWGAWNETGHNQSLNPVEDKIRMYREHRSALQQPKEEEEQADFFLDMTPRITKQKKILLQSNEVDTTVTNHNLSLAPDPVFSSSELGVWEESQKWEAEGGEDVGVSDFLREQKRQERERRSMEQQRRKNERSRQIVGNRNS